MLHFRPKQWHIGDVHPYYENGTLYLFYLIPMESFAAMTASKTQSRGLQRRRSCNNRGFFAHGMRNGCLTRFAPSFRGMDASLAVGEQQTV